MSAVDELRAHLEDMLSEPGFASGSLMFNASEAADLLHELERVDEYEGWADIEMMGHRRRIGFLRPVEIARRGFLEITGRRLGCEFRELWSPSAVFCIVPLDDEDTATRLQEAADRGN